ncbi:MAG: CusA/CzcA family heavy metal efflux RND transporter, partial [Saprospiraceae bacterium]|nr:CusA/CzcA family heavy metal efflux RND transporter [Saprospiraceae bacterium]
SIHHKLIVLLFTLGIIGFGIYSLSLIPIGAVPDVTNNQVQVITTSRNLSTQDVEKFLTYPVELEMANLPGVKEIRSVSKFGLSVVTIVFEDNIGTYLPRQLIAEKLKTAVEKIPSGFGSPFMGPVSTGLGEIYQYVLDVDSAYADQYTITDLRTIQDWIVKRALSGIPGVVEVNTWGGYLKQYEVAIDPERLRAMGISLTEVYDALEANNNVAGGGYIERTNESYFIRGEGLVKSLEDIRQIVVTNREGLPVFIRDLATVGFGHATRFGAITANGEGEKVLGQVMMLKDANSKAVIGRVKDRVVKIQKSLPPGVRINAFLERSELIGKTTHTIAENLILGCLIVIFVVVLLLGNLRSGLVVASLIPLSLLFALSLMYLFGVDANLMSLGAIDFGIIIDGAVIIVEYIAFRITQDRKKLLAAGAHEKQNLIDKITFQGATKMMNSAVFGQLIIIIVFIPILSLANVEGKMFRPMALVFSFALIGAMVLCFTYIPVVSSLFLKPSDPDKKNVSNRLIGLLQGWYTPSIIWALRNKAVVLGIAISFMIGAFFLFSRMGGEFVPTLDEGDFVIQPVLKTGTSLSKTIETITQMEKVIKSFPEVNQVVTRIGAAEVPTDPMSMEESDVIITLKDKSTWTTASSKDALADSLKAALSVLPGIEYEFTQPIEMRFNELITGVRADLAIKVFGEDLDQLYSIGTKIKTAIENVPGASDITLEKIAGLPQMSVVYDRQKIAKYGLNVADLNKVISMGFAGLPAGTIFEGEKQFDLVLRYDEANRKDIQNIRDASLTLPNGQQHPLREFAQITYTSGPAKISRDNTRRRIVVGVNVRNRDLESVVEDVQQIIDKEVKLPAGYSIDYGGQFENLRSAKSRLMVAVPIALVLIFILLYFAFSSVRDALMIYSAIPLASVGGILLLYLRGMPFSISAGVGFIALFGIAVLNGIVLIEHFKELKAHGMSNINQRIIVGTKERLRPVLLTAGAAALGFLPMAISNSAGAEVQRPLATVVIGGLISATLLTMIVLPVLYAIFDRRKTQSIKPKNMLWVGILLIIGTAGFGQTPVSLEQAISKAEANNAGLQATQLGILHAQKLVGTAYNIDKTMVYYGYDMANIAENGKPLHVLGLNQVMHYPSVYRAQQQVLEAQVGLQERQYDIETRVIRRAVSLAYNDAIYWQQVSDHYAYLDSLYSAFATAAARRYEVGETNYLEKITAETKQQDLDLQWRQAQSQNLRARQMLLQWIQSGDSLVLTDTLPLLQPQPFDASAHPSLRYFQQAMVASEKRVELAREQLKPDLHMDLFQGINGGPSARSYLGFTAGVGIPLWRKAQKATIEAAGMEGDILAKSAYNEEYKLSSRYLQLATDLQRYQEGMHFYNQNGRILAEALIQNGNKAFMNGEIDFLQYVQLLEQAKQLELNYLENRHLYNQTVIEMNHLLND